MILLDEDPETRVTREMETDPSFVPCRDEHCSITELHREHHRKRRFGRRPSAKRLRDSCPKCGAGIVYIPSGDHQRAHCAACGWHGYFISKSTKENESARNQP